MNGGRTISVHKNNCKLAPHHSQHLNFDEPELDQNEILPTTGDPFRFSSFDALAPFDDTPDDTPDNNPNDRTTPEPEEPPDPDLGEPDTPPEPRPGRAPLDPELRQDPLGLPKLMQLLACQDKNSQLYRV